ncbi:hydroxylysine kinase-like [Haliotis asinina]|uniref:hydroxylysine kinase-like n=1 Tax=Haliotis asinina TaxID=109174 RepID=UPI0035318EBB
MANYVKLSTSEKPSLTVSSIGDILARHYGLRMVNCQKLNGYEDYNFRIKVESTGNNGKEACCHGYTFKVLNKRNSKNTKYIEAQHEMMSLVYGSGILTPRVVPTLSGHLYLTVNLPVEGSEETGQFQCDTVSHPLYLGVASLQAAAGVLLIVGSNIHAVTKRQTRRVSLLFVGVTLRPVHAYSPYIVRLFEYVPGTIIQSVPLTPGLCYKVGVMAGRVDTALKGFDHPGFHGNEVQIWHLSNVPLILNLLHVVDDKGDISDVIKAFESRVLEHLDEFPQGITHGDFNDGNILVTQATDDDRWKDVHDVSAILDYGDSAYQPYIFEVAIAMTYMSVLSDSIPPQTASGYVLAGYLTQNDLSDREIDVLKICVCARIAQSLVIGVYTYHVDPSNDYTLTTAKEGWPRLRQLWKMDTEELVSEWRNIASSCKEKLAAV